MSVVLLTGATGFLGRHLLPLLLEQGDTVVALCRRSFPPSHERVVVVQGDISQSGDWEQRIPHVDAVYHLAGLVDLSPSKRKETWQVNVEGTRRIIAVAEQAKASHFYYVGTAFTQDRNPYEISKRKAEEEVTLYSQNTGVKVTIFKPSVIVGHSMELAVEESHGLYQVVRAIAWFHRRFEPLRQRVEGTLRLPPLELVFRIPGDEEMQLDIVPVDWVAESIASTYEAGTLWLTNPRSPRLKDLAEWIGELLWLDIKFVREFKPSPVEALFKRAARAWLPYFMNVEAFTPSLDTCPAIDKGFVQRTALTALLK